MCSLKNSLHTLAHTDFIFIRLRHSHIHTHSIHIATNFEYKTKRLKVYSKQTRKMQTYTHSIGMLLKLEDSRAIRAQNENYPPYMCKYVASPTPSIPSRLPPLVGSYCRQCMWLCVSSNIVPFELLAKLSLSLTLSRSRETRQPKPQPFSANWYFGNWSNLMAASQKRIRLSVSLSITISFALCSHMHRERDRDLVILLLEILVCIALYAYKPVSVGRESVCV